MYYIGYQSTILYYQSQSLKSQRQMHFQGQTNEDNLKTSIRHNLFLLIKLLANKVYYKLKSKISAKNLCEIDRKLLFKTSFSKI